MKYKFKKKPYAHQLTALEKSWNRDTFAYFMEMGTGKTKVLIDNLSMLYDKGKVDGALISCTKRCYRYLVQSRVACTHTRPYRKCDRFVASKYK